MTVNPVASEYTLSVSSISSPSPVVWDNSPVRDNIASCLPGGQSPSTGGSRPPFPLAPVPAEGPSEEKARVHRTDAREPGNADITDLGDDLFQIDTRMAGYQGITAGYLIRSSRPCLVETGTSTSAPVVRAALTSLGIAAADLATVVVTHIHLDHAGGVGDIASMFPLAEVVVHEKGARHLADPTRLIASARMVYGDALDVLFGELAPVPAARLRTLDDVGAVDL